MSHSGAEVIQVVEAGIQTPACVLFRTTLPHGAEGSRKPATAIPHKLVEPAVGHTLGQQLIVQRLSDQAKKEIQPPPGAKAFELGYSQGLSKPSRGGQR